MSEARSDKRRLIKDPVWGNLEFFNWEGSLLNHFLFNRLHNIVQNSSAYKVYPGLKYSRFLHTVGVCHVATQLFLNCAARADGAAESALRDEAERIESHLAETAISQVLNSFSRSFPCSQKHATMLAAIRVAALIHDIGHLPFSHVFENAMDGFRKGVFGNAIKLTAAGKRGRTKLNDLLVEHEHAGHEDVKLHELLGKTFTAVLETSFNSKDEPTESGLLRAAFEILHTESMPIARGFIIGTIDADRLDFVRRDGFFSGLFNSSVDFGRIFAFYELAQSENTECWKPRPSPRAVSETEKLLLERFLDYKYVIVHHKVHLYDEIMENILVRLMASGALEGFVDTLCDLLNFGPTKHLHDQEKRIELLQSLLTQFDDPWVEIEIRRQYSNFKTLEDPATRMLFEAYVEDRHCFRSAFKTDQDFQFLCAKHAPELTKEPTAIRNAFGASKYLLQAEASRAVGRTVLVGATDKKLSFGIRDDHAAKFVNVSELYQFLIMKKIRSLTFNFWYEDKGETEAEHEEIVAKTLAFFQKTVIQQLQLV